MKKTVSKNFIENFAKFLGENVKIFKKRRHDFFPKNVRMSRRRQREDVPDSQDSLVDGIQAVRLNSGGALARASSMDKFNIVFYIFKDTANEMFAPQNTFFAYSDEDKNDVVARMTKIEETAKASGITYDCVVSEAFCKSGYAPTVVGGLTPKYISKTFKHDANGWAKPKRKKSRRQE